MTHVKWYYTSVEYYDNVKGIPWSFWNRFFFQTNSSIGTYI